MTSHFEQRGRGRRSRRHLGTGLIAVLVLSGLAYLGIFWRVGALLQAAQTELQGGRPTAAAGLLRDARFYRLGAGRITEAEGVVALAQGEIDSGRSLLAQAREEGVYRSGLDLEVVGRLLADTARYEEIELFEEHRTSAGGESLSALWRGEAALAGGDLASAAKLLRETAGASGADTERLSRLEKILQAREGQGIAYSIFDRHGRPLIGRRLADGTIVTEVPELGPDALGSGGALDQLDQRALAGRVRLTLDLSYERAAHNALGRYSGAMVALDPRTGAVLALVNHPGKNDGGGSVHARLFEPGSIVKMLTLVAALDVGLDLDSLFPLNCTGNMTLDRRVFYDWRKHGTVEDLEQATALSCNLVFAAIGLELGQARLDDTLRRFGFDASPPSADLALSMGRTLPADPDAPRLGLANRAVGLESVTMTPLHVAVVAAAFARDGTAMRPHLVASRTALGSSSPYMVTEVTTLLTATSPETARRVGAMMRHVVTDPSGTGRRAAIPGLDFIMKTGTAGERTPGLNSVIFGYAPADNPVVAFGLVAEHTGKAELEGARIVRDFLTTVRNEFSRAP